MTSKTVFKQLADAHADDRAMRFNLAEGAEDISRREVFAKHFDLGAGKRQAVLYGEAVHYQNNDGVMQEIDNNLYIDETTDRKVYRNKANPVELVFPIESGSGNLVEISHEGKHFSWTFEQPVAAVTAQVTDGSELLRADLIQRANDMKVTLTEDIEKIEMANVMSTDSLVEALGIPGRDNAAVSALLKVANAEALDTDTLDKAVRTPYDRRVSRTEKNAELIYQNILPGVSVRYHLADGHLKEDIITANRQALDSVVMKLPNTYKYEVDEHQRVSVQDVETGETCFMFDPPYVYDSADNRDIAKVVIEDASGYCRMRYTLPESFLTSAVYPVTIDPVVKTGYKELSAIADAYIWAKNKNTNYGGVYIMRCGMGEGGESIALIRFKQLIKQRASDTIVSAYLRLCPENYGGDTEFFGCYPIKTSWAQNTVTWNSMTPGNDTHISSEMVAYISNTNYVEEYFDITNLCRSWYKKDENGNSRNFGVAVRYQNGVSTSDKYVEWTATTGRTSYNPRLVVNYVSHAGLESWWQYETMNAGRAGTAHVDIYNGNMVFDHPDIAMSGNLMPVSITHYYNSCYSEHNSCYCGMGWRTSMHQSVHKETLSSKTYYVWTDGDGTQHYFEKTGSSPYKDSEGMELKLAISGGKVTITDKEHAVMVFPEPTNTTPKFITNIQDAHYTSSTGSQITLTYVSGKNGMIDTITDGAGRVTRYVYENNLLKGIVAPDETIVVYKYDSASRLINVLYSDLNSTIAYSVGTGAITYTEGNNGPCTAYAYEQDSNMLIAASNYDGVTVDIAFDPEGSYDTACIENFAAQARRAISLEVSNGSKRGAKMLFDYMDMTTKVTSVKNANDDAGKVITYQFNDAGNVTCMFDELGFAQSAQFSSSIPNTAEQTSRLQRAVINLTPNLDFSSGWTGQLAGENDLIVQDTDIRCLSMPSARMVKSSAGETVYSADVPVHQAGKHTFSVYVKTDGLASGGAFARLMVGNEEYTSRKVKSSTANVSGGPGADGWERVLVSAQVDANDAVRLELVCDANIGVVWFACPQLETGSIPNRVNLLVNGDFANTVENNAISGTTRLYPVAWTALSGVSNVVLNGIVTENHGMPQVLTGNALRMVSYPGTSSVAFEQSVNVRGNKGDNFVVGGWLNAKSVAKIPTEGSRKCAPCIAYRFVNGSTVGDWQYVEFNREWVGWQFGCWPVSATIDYTRIDFDINYARNAQTAMFTNMFLYREQYGPSFAYDDDKNLISTANLSEQKSKMEYDDAHNLKSYIQPGAATTDKYTFDYGSTAAQRKKHLLQSSKTPMGVEQKFQYDARGNQTLASTEGTINGTTTAIKAQTMYTAETGEDALPAGVNENYVYRTYDARGNAVTKLMGASIAGSQPHERYLLKQVKDPEQQTVNYEYDLAKRVTDVSSMDTDTEKEYRNHYTYENDRIRTVTHNTAAEVADNVDVTYTFDYDELGRKTDVHVGNRAYSEQENQNDFRLLSHNEYETDRSGLLKEVQYGNGGKVEYEYDDFDRMTGVKYDGETDPRFTYEYGANGDVSYMEDAHLNQSKQVEYDLAERPCQATIRDMNSGELVYRTALKYDTQSRLERFDEETPDSTHRTNYTYDKDNRTTAIQYDDANHKVEYEYDALGRIAKRKAVNGSAGYETAYGYAAGDTDRYEADATAPLVASITQGTGANAMNYTYTYDRRGNIISEDRGNGRIVTYEYDKIGQLIRVNDPDDRTAGDTGTTWTYDYDCGGNIQTKKYYAYTTENQPTNELRTLAYGYDDDNWKDMLTSYDGHTITYDAIGNMLNDGERTYEWQAGRQLKKVTMRCTEEECKACEPGTDGGDTKLVIEFDSLNVLEGNVTSVTARAEVYNGATPVTESIPASHFTWTRNSGDAAADAIWNAQNNGTKQVTVNRSNLTGNVSISCTVQAVESYGTVHVDDTLMASHTPAVSDANDEFGIVNGDLKVDTNKAEGSYILDNGQVRITGVTLGGDLTANAMVFTSWPNKAVEFKYNADGLRTQKKVTVGDMAWTTDYILHGKLVTEMRRGNDVLHFCYDAQSRPSMVDYNGQIYTYVHNLQGDLVAMVDSSGAKVVEYRYEAWGRDIDRTLTSEIGELNPFRYRGYVYDGEIGLYYLRSRYYNAEMGRFVTRDIDLGSSGELFKHNGYCYSRNTPSYVVDSEGNSSYNILYDMRPGEKDGGKGFPQQADWWENKLVSEGNDVTMYGFESISGEKGFITKWGQMKDCDYLIIIAHGAEGTIDCNQERLGWGKEDGIKLPIEYYPNDLHNVTVRKMTYLFTCHGATPGPSSGKSLADIIALKTQAPVRAAYYAKVNYEKGTGKPTLSAKWLLYLIFKHTPIGRWMTVYPKSQ